MPKRISVSLVYDLKFFIKNSLILNTNSNILTITGFWGFGVLGLGRMEVKVMEMERGKEMMVF